MDTGCKTSRLTRIAVITVVALCCFCVLMSCGRTKTHRTSFTSWKTMEVPELGIRLEVPRKRYRPSLIGIMESYKVQIYPMYQKVDSEVIHSGKIYIYCHYKLPLIPLVDSDNDFSITVKRMTAELYKEAEEQWKKNQADPIYRTTIKDFEESLFEKATLYITPRKNTSGETISTNFYMLRYYYAPNGDIVQARGGFEAYPGQDREKDIDLAALKRIIESVRIDEKPPEIDIIYD